MTRWATFAWLLAAVALAWACYSTSPLAEDGGQPTVGTPVESPTDADIGPMEYERGVVIDGFCPAEVDPVVVESTGRDTANPFRKLKLRGTAHQGRIELEWDAPEVSGVTGYVVTRYQVAYSQGTALSGWPSLVAGSVRTFKVDGGPDYRRWSDTAEIEPSTGYRYRVFPVITNILWFPTATLVISSPPAERPGAPLRVGASFPNGDWNSLANYSLLEPITSNIGLGCSNCTLIQADYLHDGPPVNRMRVLRRESGQTQWRIVGDNIPYYYGRKTWLDEAAARDKDFDYAICMANRAGIGRAMLVSTRRGAIAETVDVGTPPNVLASRSFNYATVHWSPSNDEAVKGYHVEHRLLSEGKWSNRHYWTDHRADNFVSVESPRDSSQLMFRVRAFTADGHGPWSDWVATTDAHHSDVQEPTPKPEIVTASATHSEVHLVWRTDDSTDGLRVRFLRRRIGFEDEFRAFKCWDWAKVEEFDWDYPCTGTAAGWTCKDEVRPDTEYEYAVQTKRGDVVSPMSNPVSVRTESVPAAIERPPMPVCNLEAWLASDGLLLTWELPDDPTLKRIEVLGRTVDQDIVQQSHPVELPPDQTEYLVLTRGFPPEPNRIWFRVATFNDFGRQAVETPRRSVSASGLTHCRATTEGVWRADVGHHLTIIFRGCEAAIAKVIRHELTADGFKVSELTQPCVWRAGEVVPKRTGPDWFEGTLKCEYVDTSVKPGTWYIYELTQTLADGREFTSTHEIITRPVYDAP